MAESQSKNRQQSKVWIVIPAAGIGSRMQMDCPKQYLYINSKTIIEHTLDCFLQHPDVEGIVVVISASDSYWKALEIETNGKNLVTTFGGENRSDSVYQGLHYLSESLKLSENTWVMVHDAARPCLLKSDIDALLKARNTSNIGGLLASPVRDTMKRVDTVTNNNSDMHKTVVNTEPRENLWHALTPQMFQLSQLQEALHYCFENNLEVTDESSAMEQMGKHPMIIRGSHNNIKVTEMSDLVLAEQLINVNNGSKD